MASFAGTAELQVNFADGREPFVYKLTPRVILEIERHWPGRAMDRSDAAPAYESTLYGAWIAFGSPDNFEEFVDSIEEVIPKVAESNGAENPSEPAATGA